jgi:hypothetical protein
VPLTFQVFVQAGRVHENLDVALKKFEFVFHAMDANKGLAEAEFYRAQVTTPLTMGHLMTFDEIEKKVIHKQSLRN